MILVGSSINERDQMFFISTDEGSSFQRQPVSFSVETLLFHPSEEDKLLAYSKEAKVSRESAIHREQYNQAQHNDY